MKPGESSQTAIKAAALRAAHTLIFEGPTIHNDDYALELVGIPDADILHNVLKASELPDIPKMSAYFALRHQFSEELLLSAIERGVQQIVLLGAGLDSFALRYPKVIKEVDFFEVDHPNTQQWKLDRIDALGLSTPDVRYLPVDFSTQNLKKELLSVGLNFDQRIFFSWLGVTQYITRQATFQTLGLIAQAKLGSDIVFDFIVTPEDLDEAGRLLHSTYAASAESSGEPWISFYRPDSLTNDVIQLGFNHVQCLTPEEAQRRYYAGQPANVVSMQEWQLIHATV